MNRHHRNRQAKTSAFAKRRDLSAGLNSVLGFRHHVVAVGIEHCIEVHGIECQAPKGGRLNGNFGEGDNLNDQFAEPVKALAQRPDLADALERGVGGLSDGIACDLKVGAVDHEMIDTSDAVGMGDGRPRKVGRIGMGGDQPVDSRHGGVGSISEGPRDDSGTGAFARSEAAHTDAAKTQRVRRVDKESGRAPGVGIGNELELDHCGHVELTSCRTAKRQTTERTTKLRRGEWSCRETDNVVLAASHVWTLTVVGLRATHLGFFLLGLLRHSPAMLTGNLGNSDGYARRQRALPPEYGVPDASVFEHT